MTGPRALDQGVSASSTETNGGATTAVHWGQSPSPSRHRRLLALLMDPGYDDAPGDESRGAICRTSTPEMEDISRRSSEETTPASTRGVPG